MLLRLFPILVLSLACAIGQAQQPSVDPAVAPETVRLVSESRDLFVAALKRTGKQRLLGLQQSYAKLQEAADGDPAVPPARTMWAKMLTSAGDQKAGRVALQQATIEDPDDPEAYVILANFAVVAGQLAEAEAMYIQAEQRLEPWPAQNLRKSQLLAQVSVGRGSIAQSRSLMATQNQMPELAQAYDREAVNYLQQTVVAAPDNATAYQSLATALFKTEQFDEAKDAFDRARELNDQLPLTEMWMARMSVAAGNEQRAREIMEDAQSKYPENVSVIVTTADLMMVLGEPETASRYLRRALELDPDDLDARRLDAQRLRFEADWTAAAEKLQQLNNEFPTDFATANLLALTLSESEKVEDRQRAVSVATVTAQRFSNKLKSAEGQRSLVTLTWAGYASGKIEPAKKALNQLLSLGIQSHVLSGDEAYYLSQLLVEFGRPELAASLLKSAVARKVSFPKRDDAEQLLEELM